MNRDQAVQHLRDSGLQLEAAWLEAFAPSAEEWAAFQRENRDNPAGGRDLDETDDEFVRRIGYLLLSWRRARNGESADERELANSWHAVETLFAVHQPQTLKHGPWEVRPDWKFDDGASDDESEF